MTAPTLPRTAVLRAELIKFRTIPRWPAAAAACVLAGLAVGVLLLASLPVTQNTTVATIAEPRDVVDAAILGIDAAAVGMILLAAGIGGAEWRTGQAATTFLLTPRRGRVVAAKAVVVGGIGLLVGVLAAVVAVSSGEIALLLAGRDAVPVDGAVVRLALGSALAVPFYGLVALAGSLLTRGVAGGVVTALAVLALPTALGWIPPLAYGARALPSAAIHTVAGVAQPGSVDDLPLAVGVASLLAWTAVALLAAAWRVRLRDV